MLKKNIFFYFVFLFFHVFLGRVNVFYIHVFSRSQGHLSKTRIPRDECISFDHELSVVLYEFDRGYTCECSSTVNVVLQHLQTSAVLAFCVRMNDNEDV